MQNEERLLRAHIRTAIKFAKNKHLNEVNQENRFRGLIRKLILEVAAEKVETDPHEFTGINVLRELFKNSNILKTLRQSYKTLTTNPEQRRSFRAHILNWVVDTLEPIQANDQATINEEVVDIDIIGDEDKEKFIDADDGSNIESDFIDKAKEDAEFNADDEEEEEEEFRTLEDEDTTGRNRAEQVYKVIETSIVDAFSSLDDIKDQEIFKRWIIANLKLYFDKWEKELDPSLKEPESEEYNQAKEETPLDDQEAETGADEPAEAEGGEPTEPPEEEEDPDVPEIPNI
tara:strand:- start:49055 stop:49918 length:864 start_codon:yes stop_codon:yes gene_type:complete